MNVLMLVISNVDHDSRVQREARALAHAGHTVSIIALAGSSTPQYEVIPVGADVGPSRHGSNFPLRRVARWLLLPTYLRAVHRRFDRAAQRLSLGVPTEVVHAHDFPTLQMGRAIADREQAKLIYDAHECWGGRRKDGRDTVLMDLFDLRVETNLARTADAVITVSPMLALWLQRRLRRPVTVVRNTFPLYPTSVQTGRPRGLVYAGNVGPGRDLETLAAADLPVRTVVMGRVVGRYPPSLSVDPATPVDEVDEVYRRNGLALVPLTADCLNHRLALPNKLFHAVRACVPVVAAALPQLSAYVERHDLGVVYQPGRPDSLEQAVRLVLRNHDRFVIGVTRVRPSFDWAHDADSLVNLYENLQIEGSRPESRTLWKANGGGK